MPSTAYYRRLITSEYQASSNMLAWLESTIQPMQDELACAEAMGPAFDVELAEGVQLDILGVIVGQSRTVDFQPSDGVSPILDDGTYRILLKARIAQWHWNGRIGALLAIWRSLFPGGVLIVSDNQDMSVNIFVAVALSSIMQDLITHGYILPRPEGVLYNYAFAGLPMLGFDRNDDYVAGFDAGLFI